MGIIDLKVRPQQAEHIVSQAMPPESVLLNLKTGYYFSTNQLGTEIWKRCNGTSTLSEIVEELTEQFEVRREVLIEDVLSFVNELIKEKLVLVD